MHIRIGGFKEVLGKNRNRCLVISFPTSVDHLVYIHFGNTFIHFWCYHWRCVLVIGTWNRVIRERKWFCYLCVLTELMEKAMAPHSSTLAWKIPWMEEPGRLQSMGSRRVGLNWATSLSLFTFMHWRRKWQPTPVFLPGESQGRGSLVGFRLWGRTELDTTEVT